MNALSRLAILSVQSNPDIGDIASNLALARQALSEGAAQAADLVVLPELSLCGYPPQDLVLRAGFVAACRQALQSLAEYTADTAEGPMPGVVIGLPFAEKGCVYNAVALLADGRVQAVRFKHELPDYGVFDETRVFMPGPLPKPVLFRGWSLGLAICEDLWHRPVAQALAEQGAQILIACNGSPWRRGKRQRRLQALAHIRDTGLPLVWVNRFGGQDELVFDGASFARDAQGHSVQQLPDFQSATSLSVWEKPDTGPVVCTQAEQHDTSSGEEEIYRAIVLAVRDYVSRSGFEHVLLGLSGGVDSALAAAFCVDALGPDRVHSVMMPWRYTRQESLDDARLCAQSLRMAYQQIELAPVLEGLEAALQAAQWDKTAHSEALALARENMQARARGLILMSLSNAKEHMLISTGNRSELACGYATLYGDMCGGYNPLKGLYKTDVYALAHWRRQNRPQDGLGPAGPVIPERILTRAPSAELRADQTDQDTLPDYALLDTVLRALIEDGASLESLAAQGYDRAMLKSVIGRLYRSEYKRYQAAPGPRIEVQDFGRDRRYPLNQSWRDQD